MAALSQRRCVFASPVAPNGEIDVRLTAGTARFATQSDQMAVAICRVWRLRPARSLQDLPGGFRGRRGTHRGCLLHFQPVDATGSRAIVSRALSSKDGFRGLPLRLPTRETWWFARAGGQTGPLSLGKAKGGSLSTTTSSNHPTITIRQTRTGAP